MKKEITFVYASLAEKINYTPICEEAKRRGYKVKMTDNPFEKCEIGFYCQHVNFPQYSKFSVIMLHDIIQQYANWPDIWFREPWNKYHIGILPSEQWENNWKKCSGFFYTRPKIGIYKVGWPKADSVAKMLDEKYRKCYKEKFYREHGMDLAKKTILYAPSWENDGKQDDFVQSMLKLDVNILIKQADWLYRPDIRKNVQEMYEYHKDIERVKQLDPSTNIFDAIAAADILVSEESSTMCEAAMIGIPAVSVSDWLIPDVTPSRFPKHDYDFVECTTKNQLSQKIQEMIDHYEEYRKKIVAYGEKMFSNVGKTAAIIMDIVDDCIAGKPVRYQALVPQKKQTVQYVRYFRFYWESIKREVRSNYCERSKVMAFIWKKLKTVKTILING